MAALTVDVPDRRQYIVYRPEDMEAKHVIIAVVINSMYEGYLHVFNFSVHVMWSADAEEIKCKTKVDG